MPRPAATDAGDLPTGRRPRAAASTPEALELKRAVAETLARSRLDRSNGLMSLNAFLRDFRWEGPRTARDAADRWRGLEAAGDPPRHVFSVYVHVPYCLKKCHFCYCATKVTLDRSRVESYADDVLAEAAFFAPLARGRAAGLLQVGGGTPNLLSAGQLERLLRGVASAFELEPEGLRTIEFNPAGAEPAKLLAARAAGFNRISFGVQSLDPRVLEAENREYQNAGMVRDGVRLALEAGFECVNVDLVLGLDADTTEGFLSSFEACVSSGPTTVTVTALNLTDAYLKLKRTSRQAKQARLDAMLGPALEGMMRLGERAGFATDDLQPGKGEWMLLSRSAPPAFLERSSRWDSFEGGNVSVMGLGQHARSQVFGQAAYERAADRRFSPDAPLYRLAETPLKAEMMRYLVYALENESLVRPGAFRDRFGAAVEARFGPELACLEALGRVRRVPEGFRFLPVRPAERLFYGLFLFADILPELRRRFDA